MTKDKSLSILRTNIIFKGLSLKQIEGVTGHSLVQNDFLFFVGFFCVYQCEGVFFHGQKSKVAQNLNTSRVFNQMLTQITTDFCSVLKSSSKKIEHKKNHKKFSLTFRKEVAIKANKSLKKKKQMFGILKNENEKKKKQPAKLNIKH